MARSGEALSSTPFSAPIDKQGALINKQRGPLSMDKGAQIS